MNLKDAKLLRADFHWPRHSCG